MGREGIVPHGDVCVWEVTASDATREMMEEHCLLAPHSPRVLAMRMPSDKGNELNVVDRRNAEKGRRGHNPVRGHNGAVRLWRVCGVGRR